MNTAPACPALAPIMACAMDAARAAGVILANIRARGDIQVHARERHDVKLAADVASENCIRTMLRAIRPQDGILAEESGADALHRDGLWIIDPLDGTVNFSHGHPHFCVSLAWAWRGVTQVGVIYDPVRDELFSAQRGGGAHLNGAPMRCATTTALGDAMIAIGLSRFFVGPALAEELAVLSDRTQKVRICGAAALDLAYTACGRMDGYFEQRVFVWDLAAGMLLVEEAGGRSCWWRRSERAHQRACLATAPVLFAPLLALLNLDERSDARTCLDD
jgi:myo-inositol-1(or 4)-monophosphatase